MSLNKLIKLSSNIFEFLHDGVAVVNKEGIIIYVNDANQRITGFDKHNLLGKNVKNVVPYSHLPIVLSTGDKLIGVKTEVNSKNVISNIVPIFIGGKMEGAISIFRDISEVLYLSKKLDEANSTIEALFEKLNFMNAIENTMVIGKSKSMDTILKLTQKASLVTSTVLIQGESGTGKEVIARVIHKYSDRSDKPFIALNCAAIPENLLESELFGYEEGAFTGAKKGGRPGVFELSHKGTIFLDEIGDMSMSLQAKFLRVLQDKEVLRIGGEKHHKIDVRIIAATNKNLYEMLKNHNFREDLYYRLEVINIHLPPLRDRKEDIQLYIDNAINKICAKIQKPIPQMSGRALKYLLKYEYPGNIRELENILEMAIVLDDDGFIDIDDLPLTVINHTSTISQCLSENLAIDFEVFPSMKEIEKLVLKNAVNRYKSKTKISNILKISRSTLYRKLEQYGLLEETTE